MIWKKITIETTTEAVDMISYTLGELGVEGIEVEDKIPLTEEEKQAMYIDILPELPPDDGIALISCYIDNPETDVEALVEKINIDLEDLRQFMEIGSGTITIGETEDKDWINNWKEFFHPFWLDNILIKPTWIPESEVERKAGDIMVEIDPGTAFGTGAHETTKLCIAQLKKYLTGEETVFDVGCGSGILSIIASKLGAKTVFGVDIDPLAVEASYENIEVNGIDRSRANFMQGNVIGDADFRETMLQTEGSLPEYDVVVANILADVIIPLSAKIAPFMKQDGVFISSGIINMKEDAVREALLSNGFEIIETTYMKDWVSFTAKKV
ncbi:MAG: 50S ribosomal protein L11 methyltransferase [Lachnospiraceae bacterium]|nr:50S ribosomal protein L11 methyltransferase [Lachnospiraceae bacterium]